MSYFTVVIPTFNRGHLLERALRSCLAQEFTDWEAIVVDDASNDFHAISSAEVVSRIGDPRVRLIFHEENRGVCEARNTGSRAAQGLWLIFLDDDDTFVPGALVAIHHATERAGSGIHRLVFAYRDDDDSVSPRPALTEHAVWDYRGYLEWLERVRGRSDFMNCIHRDVLQSICWPRDRSREDLFHLELARRFRTECHSDVVAIINNDAANRFTAVPGYERVLSMAPDLARQMVAILNEHGMALRTFAPRTFAKFLRHAAINNYMAGHWRRGLRYSTALVRHRPLTLSAWGVLLFGILGPRPTAAVVALAKRRVGAGYRKETASA